MAKESGLAIGIEPAFADFKARPDLIPEFIRRYIDTQVEHLRVLGYTPLVAWAISAKSSQSLSRQRSNRGGSIASSSVRDRVSRRRD